MIKYIGSKRRLVPVLGEMAAAAGATTGLDLFTGTTRVAQEMKRRGLLVTAVDTARYSEAFARCYIEADADAVDVGALEELIAHLDGLPGLPGYVTETFCTRSRFFQPHNGARIDAIREAIEDHAGTPLHPVLLTSLLEAADRVDSTTGVQMAYVKEWSPRSYQPLALRVPDLLAGPGVARRADACAIAPDLGPFDIAYLDPPYNQHRYFTNYHIWETLVAWDAPAHYGIACKRADARDAETASVFNRRRGMPPALREVIAAVRATLLVVSYNDESWVTLDDLAAMVGDRAVDAEDPDDYDVAVLGFDSRRYIGARIGIFNPRGEKVGRVSHLRNVEYVVVGGPRSMVREVVAAGRSVRPLVA